MPQARDEAGNIWETDAQGNPVRLLQAASAQGNVFRNPYRQRDEQRKDVATDIFGRMLRFLERHAGRAPVDAAA